MTISPPGLDLPRLQTFFDTRVPEATGPIRAELLSGGRSNLTYRLTDGNIRWVLRRPPLGGLTPSAHDIGREYRIVEALQGSGLPVARSVALCEDVDVIGAPFGIVSYVEGTVIRTQEDLAGYGQHEVDAAAYALVDVLTALHAVPYEQVGLGRFGKPQGYLGRQVRRWYDQWRQVASRQLADVDRLYERLRDATPPESGASIVHGDLRIDNVIFDAADVSVVRAVVDWEMATLGDPLADLGLHLVYRDPLFEPVVGGSAASVSDRMPGASALADRYATASGRDLNQLSFYLALGYFKSAVIAEGIHARHASGVTVGEGFGSAGSAVPALAAAGLEAISGRSAVQ
nr:phosphotransferase family protein [Frankia sp. Cr2]